MRLPGRATILRAAGLLLVILGALHLAVTPFIERMVKNGASTEAVAWLTPPMLLNHVVVGILLLPLGILTYYAGPHAAAGARWAIVVTRTVAVTVVTLPVVLFWLMGVRYFDALPFRLAAGIVCVGSIILLAAAFWPVVIASSANHPDPVH